MNFLVIGSEGNLGRILTKTIIDNGDFVYGIDIKKKSTESNNYQLFKVNPKEDYSNLVFDRSIDAIVHLAAIVGTGISLKNPEYVLENNFNVLLNTLKIMEKNNLKNIIYTSSSALYAGKALHEDTVRPTQFHSDKKFIQNPYAASKLIGEIVLESYKNSFNFNPICLRLFDMYYDHMESEQVPVFYKFCYNAVHDKEIIINGDGNNKISFLYMKDTANVIYNICKEHDGDFSDIRGTYDLCPKEYITLNELVENISKELGRELKVTRRVLSKDEEDKDTKVMVGNWRDIEKITDYKIKVNPLDGIKIVLNSLRGK